MLPGQLSLFDIGDAPQVEEGERLREEGIAHAEGGAPAVALWEAVAVVRLIALRQETLTSDDVWTALEALWDAGAMTFPEPRVMGATLRAAQKEGWITPTDRFRPSARAVCHRRPVRIWASKLWKGREHG